MDTPPDIRLRGLVKRYGDVAAVDGIDLDVQRGEFFTLLGPSGSGKTTTLRLIAGFERRTRHASSWPDDVSDRPPFARDVNTVFQDYALFPHMTVADNVAYGLRSARCPSGARAPHHRGARDGPPARPRRPDAGAAVRRPAPARRARPRDRQPPQVLLLDEPLGALDLKLRQEMQVELKRIQQEVEITFVYVTHDQEEALTMSDRLAVFNHGRIEQIGAPAEVYEHPRASSSRASSASRTCSSAAAAGSRSGRRRSACSDGEPRDGLYTEAGVVRDVA